MSCEPDAPAGDRDRAAPPMRWLAVTTCLHYADFLAQTLPTWRTVFDRICVVTRPDDLDTRRVCDSYYVDVVCTEAFGPGGGFCKGKGINAGIRRLAPGPGDWLCHIDSDIALPPQADRFVRDPERDPAYLYGIDRVSCPSWPDWARYHARGVPQLEGCWKLHLGHFEPMARLIYSGFYLPIGFFQLWHPYFTGRERYPEGHTDAGREDALHAMKWPGRERRLIPEFVGVHLDSDPKAGTGVNWKGRVTPRFGP